MDSTAFRAVFAALIFVSCHFTVFAQTEEPAEEIGGASDLTYPSFDSPKDIPPRDFARDPGISSVSLSPDGKHFLTVSPNLDQIQLRIFSAEGNNAESLLVQNVPRRDYEGVYWATNDRIIVELESWRYARQRGRWRWVRYNQLVAADHTGGNIERLKVTEMSKSLSTVDGLVVDMLPSDPDNILIMSAGENGDDPAISKLDIYTGELSEYMLGQAGVSVWMTDAKGVARLGIGVDDDRLKLIARPASTDEWLNLHDNEIFEDGRFFPLKFTDDGNSMYVRSAIANGRFSIYQFDLSTGQLAEKIYEHPDVDTRGIEMSKARNSLLAVTYIQDRLERKYFDEKHEKLMRSVDAALPGRSNYILDQTTDDRFFLVYSVSDRYPGALYRIDTKEKIRMEVLSEMNSRINPALMSPTRRINYFARDGLEIPAYLTIPKKIKPENLPAIIFPHGGPHARTDQEYDRTVQFLASRGYLVLQPNFRGSTGYSYEYQSLGHGEWGGAMQDDLEDSVDYLVEEGMVDPERVCIVGLFSYSSYAALLGTMNRPEKFQCGVAVSPLIDLKKYVAGVRKGSGKNAAKRIIGDRKSKEINRASPIKIVKMLQRPILIYYDEDDRITEKKDFERFEKALAKAGKSFEVMKNSDGGDLSLPRERTKFYRKLEKFLEQHIGAGEVMSVNSQADGDVANVNAAPSGE